MTSSNHGPQGGTMAVPSAGSDQQQTPMNQVCTPLLRSPQLLHLRGGYDDQIGFVYDPTDFGQAAKALGRASDIGAAAGLGHAVPQDLERASAPVPRVESMHLGGFAHDVNWGRRGFPDRAELQPLSVPSSQHMESVSSVVAVPVAGVPLNKPPPGLSRAITLHQNESPDAPVREQPVEHEMLSRPPPGLSRALSRGMSRRRGNPPDVSSDDDIDKDSTGLNQQHGTSGASDDMQQEKDGSASAGGGASAETTPGKLPRSFGGHFKESAVCDNTHIPQFAKMSGGSANDPEMQWLADVRARQLRVKDRIASQAMMRAFESAWAPYGPAIHPLVYNASRMHSFSHAGGQHPNGMPHRHSSARLSHQAGHGMPHLHPDIPSRLASTSEQRIQPPRASGGAAMRQPHAHASWGPGGDSAVSCGYSQYGHYEEPSRAGKSAVSFVLPKHLVSSHSGRRSGRNMTAPSQQHLADSHTTPTSHDTSPSHAAHDHKLATAGSNSDIPVFSAPTGLKLVYGPSSRQMQPSDNANPPTEASSPPAPTPSRPEFQPPKLVLPVANASAPITDAADTDATSAPAPAAAHRKFQPPKLSLASPHVDPDDFPPQAPSPFILMSDKVHVSNGPSPTGHIQVPLSDITPQSSGSLNGLSKQGLVLEEIFTGPVPTKLPGRASVSYPSMKRMPTSTSGGFRQASAGSIRATMRRGQQGNSSFLPHGSSMRMGAQQGSFRMQGISMRLGAHGSFRLQSKPSMRRDSTRLGRKPMLALAIEPEMEQYGVYSSEGFMPDDMSAEVKPPKLQQIQRDDLRMVYQLGAGNFGSVNLMLWSGVEVAVKELKNCAAMPGEQQEEIFREAQALAVLRHPCVVAFYGIVVSHPDYATVVEYIRGGNLRHGLRKLKEQGPVPASVKAAIALQAARGMEYLHSQGWVHFDLKGENLLCDLRDVHNPVVKIADLGLSRLKQDDESAGIQGLMLGTKAWMAPELFLGGADDDYHKHVEKADLYSFGIVLWEIWSLGERPYEGIDPEELNAGIMDGCMRPDIPDDCDHAWKELMQHCWADHPGDRPPFTQVAKRLQELLDMYRKAEASASTAAVTATTHAAASSGPGSLVDTSMGSTISTMTMGLGGGSMTSAGLHQRHGTAALAGTVIAGDASATGVEPSLGSLAGAESLGVEGLGGVVGGEGEDEDLFRKDQEIEDALARAKAEEAATEHPHRDPFPFQADEPAGAADMGVGGATGAPTRLFRPLAQSMRLGMQLFRAQSRGRWVPGHGEGVWRVDTEPGKVWSAGNSPDNPSHALLVPTISANAITGNRHNARTQSGHLQFPLPPRTISAGGAEGLRPMSGGHGLRYSVNSISNPGGTLDTIPGSQSSSVTNSTSNACASDSNALTGLNLSGRINNSSWNGSNGDNRTGSGGDGSGHLTSAWSGGQGSGPRLVLPTLDLPIEHTALSPIPATPPNWKEDKTPRVVVNTRAGGHSTESVTGEKEQSG